MNINIPKKPEKFLLYIVILNSMKIKVLENSMEFDMNQPNQINNINQIQQDISEIKNKLQNKTIWEIVSIVTSLLLPILILGIGFFLVDRFRVQEIQTNTELLLDSITETKVKVSSDIMQIISNIQPNISLKFGKHVYKDKSLKIPYYISNNGPYAIYVKKPEIHLSRKPFSVETETSEKLSPIKHEIISPVIGFLPPHQEGRHSFKIIFDNDPEKGELFICITVYVETNEKILKLAKNGLKDLLSLSDEEISYISKSHISETKGPYYFPMN